MEILLTPEKTKRQRYQTERNNIYMAISDFKKTLRIRPDVVDNRLINDIIKIEEMIRNIDKQLKFKLNSINGN